jgi:hypothetical protein
MALFLLLLLLLLLLRVFRWRLCLHSKDIPRLHFLFNCIRRFRSGKWQRAKLAGWKWSCGTWTWQAARLEDTGREEIQHRVVIKLVRRHGAKDKFG